MVKEILAGSWLLGLCLPFCELGRFYDASNRKERLFLKALVKDVSYQLQSQPAASEDLPERVMRRPSLLWSCCLMDRSLHGPSNFNFRVRLLVGCDGLELDASRFRYRTNLNISPGDATCKLCNESPSHLAVQLSRRAEMHVLLHNAPACVQVHLPHDSEASTIVPSGRN